jgi:putative peptidoglycan lipid II flippase
MMYGLRQSYFLVLPAALGLIALGPPIVRLLFQRGAFDEADAARTVDALAILALGLPGFAGVKVAVQGFYAAQDTKTPVIAASMSMLLNIVLNIVLVRPLGYLGLATASAIAFTVNFAALYALLSQRYGKLWDGPFLHAVTRITLTGALMAAAAFGLFVWTASRFAEDTWGGRLICVILPMAGAVGVYAGMARLLGVEELGNLLRALKRRR